MAKDIFWRRIVLIIALTSCVGGISRNLSFINSMSFSTQNELRQQRKLESEDRRTTNSQNNSNLELSQLYKASQSEAQHRATCLQILDKKMIFRGSHISLIDNIFGTSFSENLPGKDELVRKGKVFFSPQPQSNDPSESVPNIGWYLAVEYDWKGLLKDFYLSNIHK